MLLYCIYGSHKAAQLHVCFMEILCVRFESYFDQWEMSRPSYVTLATSPTLAAECIAMECNRDAPLWGCQLCPKCGRSNGNWVHACTFCHQQLSRNRKSKGQKWPRECSDVSDLTHQGVVSPVQWTFSVWQCEVLTTTLLFVRSPPACGTAMHRTVQPCQLKCRRCSRCLQTCEMSTVANVRPSHCWTATVPQYWRIYHPSHTSWCTPWAEMYVWKNDNNNRKGVGGEFCRNVIRSTPWGSAHLLHQTISEPSLLLSLSFIF